MKILMNYYDNHIPSTPSLNLVDYQKVSCAKLIFLKHGIQISKTKFESALRNVSIYASKLQYHHKLMSSVSVFYLKFLNEITDYSPSNSLFISRLSSYYKKGRTFFA